MATSPRKKIFYSKNSEIYSGKTVIPKIPEIIYEIFLSLKCRLYLRNLKC